MKEVFVPFYGCSCVLTGKLLSTPGSFKALLEKLCSSFVAFYLSHSEVLQTLPHPSPSAPQAEVKRVSCPRFTDGETEAWDAGFATLRLYNSLPLFLVSPCISSPSYSSSYPSSFWNKWAQVSHRLGSQTEKEESVMIISVVLAKGLK